MSLGSKQIAIVMLAASVVLSIAAVVAVQITMAQEGDDSETERRDLYPWWETSPSWCDDPLPTATPVLEPTATRCTNPRECGNPPPTATTAPTPTRQAPTATSTRAPTATNAPVPTHTPAPTTPPTPRAGRLTPAPGQTNTPTPRPPPPAPTSLVLSINSSPGMDDIFQINFQHHGSYQSSNDFQLYWASSRKGSYSEASGYGPVSSSRAPAGRAYPFSQFPSRAGGTRCGSTTAATATSQAAAIGALFRTRQPSGLCPQARPLYLSRGPLQRPR